MTFGFSCFRRAKSQRYVIITISLQYCISRIYIYMAKQIIWYDKNNKNIFSRTLRPRKCNYVLKFKIIKYTHTYSLLPMKDLSTLLYKSDNFKWLNVSSKNDKKLLKL